MTGTSLDAIDVACVEMHGHGLDVRPRLLRTTSTPLGALADRLRGLAAQHPHTAGEIAAIADDFSRAHVGAIRTAAEDRFLDLIAVHGQTIYHAPPLSWQLLRPSVIAHALRTDVVFDLRAADLAAGGQGAPITPAADWILFRSAAESRTVVNLGGFCNFTHMPAAGPLTAVTGGDICLCNQMLDAIARRFLNNPYDENGRLAAAGRCDPRVFDEITAWLGGQSRSGRSLGSQDESLAVLSRRLDTVSPSDLARTACAAVAETIAARLPHADRVLLAGGGARNPVLVQEIRERCAAPCESTDDHGFPADARESVAMAVLGTLSADHVPITLPQITGATETRVAGAWIFERESGQNG